MPYSLDRDQLDYVDLDIDVIVWPDGTFRILDLEEFEQNKVTYNYPADIIANAERTMDELMSAIRDGSQPTDFLLTGHRPDTEQPR